MSLISNLDQDLQLLLLIIFSILGFATVIGQILRIKTKNSHSLQTHSTIQNLNDRIHAWWLMCAVFLVSIVTGIYGTIGLFALTSTLALKEFLKLLPYESQDRFPRFLLYFVVLPMQYFVIIIEWYGLFAIWVPVFTLITIAIFQALWGKTENYLVRGASLQWAAMFTIYFLSHVPALLTLKIPDFNNNVKLLSFLVIITQLSDVLQYVCGKLFGKNPIAPKISPNKTIGGFIGGISISTIIGGCLFWATPFTFTQACFFAFLISTMGFFGGLVMSSIKRDIGLKDYGNLIKGHGGILDRVDSICFSAPLFFHLVRYFFTKLP